MDRLFEDFSRDFGWGVPAAADGGGTVPRLDVSETDGEIRIEAELPGAPHAGPLARLRHWFPSWRVGVAISLLMLAGCASPGRPISYVPGQSVPIRSFTAELPRSPDWKGRDMGSAKEGAFTVFGRELGSTRTVLAAATDLVAPARKALYETQAAGKSDPERLEFMLDLVEQNAPLAEPGAVEGFWRGPADRPVVQQGVACQEYGYETLDHRVPGHTGEPFRMVLRGLVCLDPKTGRPIQVTYSERYAETVESLRPDFESEVNAYFDSLELRQRPSSSSIPAAWRTTGMQDISPC